jgi:hypothetical protein
MRWMARRAALLALVAGVGVALVFGGLWSEGGAFGTAFVMGLLAGATSFAVSMAIFVVAMARLSAQTAVFVSLSLGCIAAFILGWLLRPIALPT